MMICTRDITHLRCDCLQAGCAYCDSDGSITKYRNQTFENLNNETFKRLEILKDNTYYDKTGKQILVGDLLKVDHFKIRNRMHYMYHVVVMEETKDFPVMAVSAHWTTEPHCRIHVCCDKEQRVYKSAKIIGTKDWETKRKRIKVDNNI